MTIEVMMNETNTTLEKLIRVSMFGGKVMGFCWTKIRPKMNMGCWGFGVFASLRKSMTAVSVFTFLVPHLWSQKLPGSRGTYSSWKYQPVTGWTVHNTRVWTWQGPCDPYPAICVRCGWSFVQPSRKFSVQKTTKFAYTDHNLRQLTKDLADWLMGVRLQIVTIIITIQSIKVETIRAIISLNPKQWHDVTWRAFPIKNKLLEYVTVKIGEISYCTPPDTK